MTIYSSRMFGMYPAWSVSLGFCRAELDAYQINQFNIYFFTELLNIQTMISIAHKAHFIDTKWGILMKIC